ncbi:MAG: FAD-dependent oxidoreductase [Chloroflexi bacterium]|nr:FAD-dependent oxidoreductase [Chloroflexota bacterium]
MATHHLIIGNGAAGMSAAEEIRRRDHTAHITILSDEPVPMYSRPGLAYLLMGEIPETRVFCRTPDYYDQKHFHLIHARVASLDVARHAVNLDDGRAIVFDTLLLATGSSAVRASFPGSDLDGIVYLDNLANVQDILRRVDDGARAAVIVGGGITAMEMAEGLCHRGVETHYLLRKKTIWSALLTRAESQIVEDHARAIGVRIHYNEEIAEIIGAGKRVGGVCTTSGQRIACDLVGVAIGVRPNIALAKAAGITVERGIVVNELLESSAPGIFAAGDAAQVFDHWSGEYRVDDLWPSAIAAGRAAGANMAGGHTPYIKGVPFNAALLFGVHLTAIGQAGSGQRDADDGNETLQYQSRGSSEVWWARPGGPYTSAWSHHGDNSVRLVLRGDQIAGALILGNQDLADPLREVIAQRMDITPIRAQLQVGNDALARAVRALYEQHRRRNGHGS